MKILITLVLLLSSYVFLHTQDLGSKMPPDIKIPVKSLKSITESAVLNNVKISIKRSHFWKNYEPHPGTPGDSKKESDKDRSLDIKVSLEIVNSSNEKKNLSWKAYVRSGDNKFYPIFLRDTKGIFQIFIGTGTSGWTGEVKGKEIIEVELSALGPSKPDFGKISVLINFMDNENNSIWINTKESVVSRIQ